MEEFENHMSGLTDKELAEWYGEKYGKDYITDTKTMTSAQIDEIKKLYTVDVAQSFVDVGDNDTISQSAREWLNNNTSRGVDPSAQTDDILLSLNEQDEVIQRNKDFDLENALTDDDIFMRDVQPKIDDYYENLAAREPSQAELDRYIESQSQADDPFDYDIDVDEQARQAEQNRIEQLYDDTMADRAAREPNIDEVNSYYESLSQGDQEMIDNFYDNAISDNQIINVGDTSIKGKAFKKILSNRLKSLFVGGINFVDAYELGLIGAALLEPAVEKVLKPIMPMIIPGYKAPQKNESYKDQVIANLQETAKISPTAKLVEKMPEKVEYEKLDNLGYGWLGKMLDR